MYQRVKDLRKDADLSQTQTASHLCCSQKLYSNDGLSQMNEKRKKVSVSMPQELYEQLKILAKENCYTVPGYIRQILKVHVRRQADK